jgi:hypothetical protein
VLARSWGTWTLKNADLRGILNQGQHLIGLLLGRVVVHLGHAKCDLRLEVKHGGRGDRRGVHPTLIIGCWIVAWISLDRNVR